jgi:TolB-like protein
MKIFPCFEPVKDSDKKILSQLNKILMHQLFINSDILSRFLQYVVHETLSGRKDQIKEFTIAMYVLKKPVVFTSSYSSVVRVHAKRLRNALAVYYYEKGPDDIYLITIPKGRYIPLFEKMDNKESSKITGVASLFSLNESKKSRIACLPFKTYEQNVSRKVLADHLGEELTRQFSHCPDLSVLSYHTTRMLSPQKSEIKNLVSSWQVQYIITGSCHFENSNIRVFVEFIDAESEIQVWSGSYCQNVEAENYYSPMDQIVSEIFADLGKIKNPGFENMEEPLEICKKIKENPGILYLDSYHKIPKPTRRVVGN